MNTALMIDGSLTDAIISWLAAYVTAVYLVYVGTRAIPTRLERRQKAFLWCMVAFLVVRGFWWISGQDWLRTVTVVLAGFIPLVLLVFLESVLRRHAPKQLKGFIVAGALLCSLLTIRVVSPPDPLLALALLGYQFAAVGALVWLLYKRDKSSLSAAENSLVDAILIMGLLAIPLLITDFRTDLDFPHVRLGSVAVLIFIYAFVRQSLGAREKRSVMRELMVVASKGLLLCFAFATIFDELDAVTIERLAALSVTFVLAFTVLERINMLRSQRQLEQLNHWLAEVDTSSTEALMNSLAQSTLMKNAYLIDSNVGDAYDLPVIAAYLARQKRPLNSQWLEQARTRGTGELYIVEQIADLLARNQANHICVLGTEPPRLLLASISAYGDQTIKESELQIIQTLALAIGKPPSA